MMQVRQNGRCAMPASPRLAALLLAAAVLLAASASPAAADDKHVIGGGGGRMVIVRAPAGTSSRWQRRLEDEVAPEFGGLLLGADQGHISYDTLNKGRAACGDSCAAKGGKPYTRPCTYQEKCRG